MNATIAGLLLHLLSRLDWPALFRVLMRDQERRVGAQVTTQIADLVDVVDRLPASGTEKRDLVLERLRAPESPVRDVVEALPGHLLRWAIETAVTRRRFGDG